MAQFKLKRLLVPEKHDPATAEVLWQNEVHANRLTAIVMFCCSVFLILCMILTAVGVFVENPKTVYTSCTAALAWHLIPCIISYRYKFAKPWLKYILLLGLLIGQARIDCGLGYNVTLAILLPVVFSTRYYSAELTITVAAVSTVVFSTSTYLGALTGFTPADLNIVSIGVSHATVDYARRIMQHTFLPKWMLFAIISGVCAEIAGRGHYMVQRQANISQENSRIETELNTARAIQMHSLPEVEEFVKDRDVPFDLATSIVPAKEVGGDFFNYFYVDPTHLALLIADVSGKGVPAALYMMIAKLLLDSIGSTGKSPAHVLAEVNHLLCDKNLEEMFVTVWLGVLDLTSGEIITANAGHENPIICRADGTLEEITTKHGLVLGGIDGAHYRDEVLKLQPGDMLFVYTDGIPEANNPLEEMYGVERLKAALTAAEKTPTALVNAVSEDVARFVGVAPQFDDSTMLTLRLNRLLEREGLRVYPSQESIKEVQTYVESRMEEAGVPMKAVSKINIGLDEMYSNVVHHSNASWAEIICDADAEQVTVILRDNGIPFDPLNIPEPDVTLSADERHVGGLGIFMTKKMMNELTYRYVDGCNEVRMVLKYNESEANK
ncbi:MAG: SpoIIE family protein phosphatase [Clostridia bacterium]|nr:SpoIIE family protein phosphatase [Clostridia bacterium]